MQAFNLLSTPEQFVISIDKKMIDKNALLFLLQRFWVEHLAQVVDFDDSITELGEEIKEDWWNKNQERILNRIEA